MGLGMQDFLVPAQLADEFLDAFAVKKPLGFILHPFVGQRDFDAGIQEGQFAQAVGQDVELEFGGNGENGRVRFEGDERAGVLGFADDFQLLFGHAALEGHVIDLVVARNLDLEPIGKGVDAFGADAVQAARILVGALAEFAAGVQIGQHQFHGRHLPFRMHIHRNAAAVVADGNGAIDMNGDVDDVAKAGQMFVDGIVQHLEDGMVQAAFIGVSDVHARSLAHGFQSLQFIDFGGIIFARRVRRRARILTVFFVHFCS